MSALDKLKNWLFGKHDDHEVKPKTEPPVHKRETIVYEEEEEHEPPEIDEYVEIEFTKPASKDAGTKPMEGTTMVKKKTTKKKVTKKKVTKKKVTKKKTAKKKVTKKKTVKKKAVKKKTTKKKVTKKKKKK